MRRDQYDGNKTMTTAFILIALALIMIYAGPTLLFICFGYADYVLERRRHMMALKHAVRRRSDEL
jgi:type III secretory pathway component EscU